MNEFELSAQLVSICKKIFNKKMVILRTWFRKKRYSTHQSKPQRMEQSRWIDDDKILWKRTRSFRATSLLSEERSIAKVMKIINTLQCRWRNDWNFRTIISVNQLSIYGAITDVCEEYSTCQTRTVRPELARQSYPLFGPSWWRHTTFDRWFCARGRSIAKIPRTSWKTITTNRVIQFSTDAGFLTTSWQKILKNSHNSPYWKSQPATYNVNVEWKQELSL